MRTSVSLNDELAAYVDEVSSSAGENNAEAIREAIRHAKAQDARVDELETALDELRDELDAKQDELDDCRQDVDRLQNEKRLILEDRDEKQELVNYVENEMTDTQRWRRAGLGTKLKWQLLGMPDDDEQPD